MASPAQQIADILKQALVDAIKDRKDELTAIAEAGGKEARSDPFGDVGGLAGVLALLIGVAAQADPATALPVDVIGAAEAAGGKGGRAAGMGYLLGYTLFELSTPYLNFLTHAIAGSAESELWPPDIAARLANKGLIPTTNARKEGSGSGFDAVHMDAMIEDAASWPDMLTLLTMRDRSLITEDDLNTALQRHGYLSEWWPKIKGLSRQLLSPADLALATLRGNLDESVARAYAHILSVTDADFNVLIDNTGEPPGPEQLMEALRRGFIDQARFERGIRQSRVRNEWIDVETALRQSPMTTADAIRAVVQSYLTDAEGQAIAHQNGLIPDHWRPLVESFGRPLSHEQMLTLFHRGKATRDEVVQAFHESDLKNKYADQAIELGRRLVPERTIVTMLHHGVITHDTAMTMLKQQGFNDADAEALIKLGAAEATSAHKNLSRSDLVAMYEDGLMPKAEAVKRLVTLGYDHADAVAALDLADFKANATKVRTLQRGIEASLKAKHLTPAEAIQQLTASGLDHAQAQRLVDQWLQQRGTTVHALTNAEIASAAYYGMITFDQAVAGIQALGWSKNDAKIIVGVRLRGLPEGVTVEPPRGN